MYSEVDEAADISKEKLVADFKVVVADAEALLKHQVQSPQQRGEKRTAMGVERLGASTKTAQPTG